MEAYMVRKNCASRGWKRMPPIHQGLAKWEMVPQVTMPVECRKTYYHQEVFKLRASAISPLQLTTNLFSWVGHAYLNSYPHCLCFRAQSGGSHALQWRAISAFLRSFYFLRCCVQYNAWLSREHSAASHLSSPKCRYDWEIEQWKGICWHAQAGTLLWWPVFAQQAAIHHYKILRLLSMTAVEMLPWLSTTRPWLIPILSNWYNTNLVWSAYKTRIQIISVQMSRLGLSSEKTYVS